MVGQSQVIHRPVVEYEEEALCLTKEQVADSRFCAKLHSSRSFRLLSIQLLFLLRSVHYRLLICHVWGGSAGCKEIDLVNRHHPNVVTPKVLDYPQNGDIKREFQNW